MDATPLHSVDPERPALLTVGHGRLDADELTALLTGAGIEWIIDIRRFPGSRAAPAASRDVLPGLLESVGIGYRWDERLGGRRRLRAAEDRASPDAWWRVAAFRAYAAWTRSDDFRDAVPDLARDVARQRAAIMCSETVWWRCHRRLVADVAARELGLDVLHLMHDGKLRPHPVSDGARPGPDGRLIWDGGSPSA